VSNILDDVDILGEIENLELDKRDYISSFKKRISDAEKYYDGEIDKIRSKCKHELTKWEVYLFKNEGQCVRRGCPLCGLSEYKGTERHLRESQDEKD